MKLSKIYSNKPKIFPPINFKQGLNVVLAEIRLPENKDKDTHNLGKTTLGRLIDFCLLLKRHKDFFLFKHSPLFDEFIFYIELELLDGTFLTIRRSVEQPSKISFKKSSKIYQEFTDIPDKKWDHVNLPFERSKNLLDSLLDLQALKSWTFRKGLGYQLRSQADFSDVFQLRKYQSSHADWKPFLAHILGFNAKIISDYYQKESELGSKEDDEKKLNIEVGGKDVDLSRIEGLLLLALDDSEKKQRQLDAFDFRESDSKKTSLLVEDINESIARLNSEKYYLSQNKKKVETALEEHDILFDPDEAELLFKEVGLNFPEQIKRDFEQLIAFNQAVTEERRTYLEEENREIENEIRRISTELNTLGERRSDTLAFLSDTDVFTKYKQLTEDLISLKADITSFERQREFLRRLQGLRREIHTLREEKERLKIAIEENVYATDSDPENRFSQIRLSFSRIIEQVIDRKALLRVEINQQGHLEFKAEILDESGKTTSANSGHTYQKLLCIAFDLATAKAYADEKFPHFIFHDGVFESLDDRKKAKLLNIIRQHTEYGIQNIITLIDSDLPPRESSGESVFDNLEIILTLHDDGIEGRLFKMKSW